MIRNLARAALVSLSALALTACFTSEEALITPDTAEQPFAAGAYFNISYEDGDADRNWNGNVSWEGMASIGRDDGEQEDDFPLDGYLYREIAPSTFIAMSPEDDGFWYAVVFTWSDGAIGYFMPDCSQFSEEGREAVGVELNDDDVCVVEDWDQLKDAFLAYLVEKQGEIELSGALFPVE
jgi:hypothetical protein